MDFVGWLVTCEGGWAGRRLNINMPISTLGSGAKTGYTVQGLGAGGSKLNAPDL